MTLVLRHSGASLALADLKERLPPLRTKLLDTTISKNGMIEMYADPTSRGGILEPDGVVSVNYRLDKQRQAMARLDPQYAALVRGGNIEAIAAREKEIGPTFPAIAVAYAKTCLTRSEECPRWGRSDRPYHGARLGDTSTNA